MVHETRRRGSKFAFDRLPRTRFCEIKLMVTCLRQAENWKHSKEQKKRCRQKKLQVQKQEIQVRRYSTVPGVSP